MINQNKDYMLRVRLSEKERKSLEKLAKKNGMSLSQFVRFTVLYNQNS